MSMITIQKSELEEMEKVIKEKDHIIARQREKIAQQIAYQQITEGYRLYHAILFAGAGVTVSKLIRHLNRVVIYPEGSPEETARNARLADNELMVAKHEEDFGKAAEAWQAYLSDHPPVEEILVGQCGMQIPQNPAEVL